MVNSRINEFKDNLHANGQGHNFTKKIPSNSNFKCLSPVIEHKLTFRNVLQMQMSSAFVFKKIMHGA
ncbi:hypothetical protein HKD37_01G000077 [Glycine soja]